MGLHSFCLTSSGMYSWLIFTILFTVLSGFLVLFADYTLHAITRMVIFLDFYFAVNDVMYVTVLTKFIYLHTHM